MAHQCRTFQIGGHYRGTRFRVTVWLEQGKTPYVHHIDIDGMTAVSKPVVDGTPATVNDALDMGFRLAQETIAVSTRPSR